MSYTIAKIQQDDDPVICDIIKQVGAEFGAVGDGFGPSDTEVLCMSQHYLESSRSLYLVARLNGVVVGGCGIAPFNASNEICELKKLFLLPPGRGFGIGRALASQCLDFARLQGFQSCYLDTLKSMSAAIALYETLGFSHLDGPLPSTLHGGCDVWMLKQLQSSAA